MATTPTYGWSTPDDTALVSAGASAIRTALNAVDSTLGGQKNIKQIVTSNISVAAGSSSTTFTSTGLTANITPTKSTNQILVVAAMNACGKRTSNIELNLRIVRGATTLLTTTNIGGTNAAGTSMVGSQTLVYLDSPATTSATTYTVQFASTAAANDVQVSYGGTPSYLFLFEIGV